MLLIRKAPARKGMSPIVGSPRGVPPVDRCDQRAHVKSATETGLCRTMKGFAESHYDRLLLCVAHLVVDWQQQALLLSTLGFDQWVPMPQPGICSLPMRAHDATSRRHIAIQHRLHHCPLIFCTRQSDAVALPIAAGPVRLDRRHDTRYIARKAGISLR